MKLRPTSIARVSLGIAVTIATSTLVAEQENTSPSTAPSPVLPPGTSATTGSATAPTGSTVAAPSATPDQAEMMRQMIELSKLNDNHKLLASLDGSWNFKVKFWMNGDPASKPNESTGTAVRKSIMGGRFVAMDVTGKMQMPGADGKMKSFEFKGHGMEGYDNAKQKFVGTWMDNMGTGIMMSEGTYDPAGKTFSYSGEVEPMPGMKQQVREALKLTDKDHMTLEWYENHNGQDVKTMEINYTRTGKGK